MCDFVFASVFTLTQWAYWLWCHQEDVGDTLCTTCDHGGASSDPSGDRSNSCLVKPSLAQVPTKAVRINKVRVHRGGPGGTEVIWGSLV